VWVAPIGTKLGDPAWTELPVNSAGIAPAFTSNHAGITMRWDESGYWQHAGWKPAGFANETPAWLRPRIQDKVNEALANMKRASDRYSIKQPVKWSTTINALPSFTKEQLELYYGIRVKPDAWGNWAVTLPGSNSTNNERSKPVGLTTNHKYTDNDGDTIEASEADSWAEGDVVALLKATDNDSGESASVYVTPEYSLSLALNVLGYDRPSAKPYAAGSTSYNGKSANRSIPSSKSVRDAHIAEAIDLLIGADIYDPREAERKAREAERLAANEAKKARDAKLATELGVARERVRRISESVAYYGITAVRADELAEATAKYKAAYEAHAGS
jgi:hypothetical protein